MDGITPVRQLADWLQRDRQKILLDAAVFSRVYEKTHVNVFRYLSALSAGGREEAEDMTAEVYLRAWKSRARFRGDEEAALGWLLRIARNLAFDAARRRKGYRVSGPDTLENLAQPDADPETDLIRRERDAALRVLLARATEEEREMLVLRYILEWQVKAIAAQMDLAENTISVKIRRALARLERAWLAERRE